MVVFDSAVLTLLLWDQARPLIDPATGLPVERYKERMELLVQTLHKSKQTILVPTPVVSEVLMGVEPWFRAQAGKLTIILDNMIAGLGAPNTRIIPLMKPER